MIVTTRVMVAIWLLFLLVLITSYEARMHLAKEKIKSRHDVQYGGVLVQSNFGRNKPDDEHDQKQSSYSTWSEAETEAKKLISKMTLEEKVNLTTGIAQEYCTGMSGSVPRLNIPSFCLSDGTSGVGGTYNVSQFPTKITLAATWKPELARLHGAAMGQEFHKLGVNFVFAPVAGGPLGRSPLGGRNWESLGADEYLTGRMGSNLIKGLQIDAGMIACTKHFIGYEQETQRNPKTILPQIQKSYSSNIDDFTMHQLYLWSFAEAVRAGTGQVMCSYNRINGTQQCQNDASLNGLLKGELSFGGSIVSDFGAAYSNEEATKNGLDLLMPGDGFLGGFPNYRGHHGKHLKKAVKSGKVKEDRIDDMVKRILTPILRFQYTSKFENFIHPKIHNAYVTLTSPKPNDIGNSLQGDHNKIIRRVGSESITMVKNIDNSLPLNKEKLGTMNATIAIIGSDAFSSTDQGISCSATNSCDEIFHDQGTQMSGGGSGFALATHLIGPIDSIKSYVKDVKQITIKSSRAKKYSWGEDSISNAIHIARTADVVLLFGNARAKEDEDRKDLKLREHFDDVIKQVAAVNNHTIVILHTPGPVLMEEWIEHPNVTSVLYAYYPGQEAGSSLTPMLFGDQSPSGKLPFVIAKKLKDWLPNSISIQRWSLDPQIQFDEGSRIDWKWLDAKHILPRFPFGFGLTYTNFTYHSLSVEKTFQADHEREFATNETFVVQDSVQGTSLYDTILQANLVVHNTGSVKASEVVQLYVSFSEQEQKDTKSAPHLLRGFRKEEIEPGQSVNVSFAIRRKDVSIWDVFQQRWRIPLGEITFFVGPQGAAEWEKKLQSRITF